MKKVLENPYLSLIIRIALGGIFVLWSISKIADANGFAESIDNYQILSNPFIGIMALTLPWIELVCGLFLIVGIRLKANSAIIAAMLFIFIIAISSAMLRGISSNCGCGSDEAVAIGLPKLIEDILMLAGALYIYFYPVKTITIERLSFQE